MLNSSRKTTFFTITFCALLFIGTEYHNQSPTESPVRKVPNIGEAAEAYFSPSGTALICNAKRDGDTVHQVYTLNLDGTNIRRINNRGEDACSFYFPSGDRLIYTSTKDNLHLPRGDWSKAAIYPQGAELYTCDLDGSNVKRLTFNEYYDAEVSVSPDGQWILFARQIDGRLDLWRMRPDGSEEFQITRTPDLQEGGAFYMPDGKTILFRAWKIQDQGLRPMPMEIFTIEHDGRNLRQITNDGSTNWAPFPHPDGKHFVFVKVVPKLNYELFLMNIETDKQIRLTYNEDFDGLPSISPDGKTVCFASGRGAPPGKRMISLYTMDISKLLE